ncbi:MAG: ABC transporter substrate-binding protein [Lachnospiraceae bacterium]|nr:ABC transporter substrate-binding protein [Lachnospiraceae bacterium]
MKKVVALGLSLALGLSSIVWGAEDSTVYSIKVSGQPYIHALASVNAIDKGYISLEDSEVDMYSSGPVQNEAIASDSWDVGTTGTGGAVLGAVGYNLKVIAYSAPDENTTDLWVRADSSLAQCEQDENGVYGTADDWKGLTILCPTGTSCHMTLIGVLDYLGLSQEDINLIDSSVADSYAAFRSGTGDVVALWSPFGFQAEENEEWIKVASAVDIGLTMPTVVVATEQAIETNWDGVYAYLKGYLKSADELNADPEGTAELLYDFEEEQGINMSENVSALEVKNRPFTSTENNIELFTADAEGNCKANNILLQFAEFFQSQGKIEASDLTALQESGMVDTSFMMAIAAE